MFYNKFISCLYMFRAHILIIRRSKLHYTASGIITPIGSRLVYTPVLSQPVHETATYRCDVTRDCVMQFWPPDDEHILLETCRGMKQTYCRTNILCIKLVNYLDKYTDMHGQQNVEICYSVVVYRRYFAIKFCNTSRYPFFASCP